MIFRPRHTVLSQLAEIINNSSPWQHIPREPTRERVQRTLILQTVYPTRGPSVRTMLEAIGRVTKGLKKSRPSTAAEMQGGPSSMRRLSFLTEVDPHSQRRNAGAIVVTLPTLVASVRKISLPTMRCQRDLLGQGE